MKQYLLALIFVLPLLSFSQEEQPTEWTLFAEQNGVEIYHKYADCDLEMGYDQQWVILKFVNTTSVAKLVDFNKIMEIDGDCKTCNDPYGEYHMTVPLAANETSEGSCTIYDKPSHHIYSKVITPDTGLEYELTDFDLSELTVTDQE